MTDLYVNGFKVTLVTLRGGSRVIVVRDSMTLRYVRHFTDLEHFDKWIDIVTKEYSRGKVESDEEG